METFLQDLRFGFRMLVKSPGFTLAAVLCLVLGVGANSAIFTLVNAILLRPLPYKNPDQLLVLWGTNLQKGWDRSIVSPANFKDWKNQAQAFDHMAAWEGRFFTVSGSGEPQQVWAHAVSADLFPLLGVKAAQGRTFIPEEFQPGREKVVILARRFSQQRFGTDSDVIGKVLVLDGETYTVVGVMPGSFVISIGEAAASQPELWVPLRLDDNNANQRTDTRLVVIGRLKPAVTLNQSQAEMNSIAHQLEQQYPDVNRGWGVTVVPLYEQVVRSIRPTLLVLLGAVGFVLLIACSNVASLLLARGVSRQREISIRAALGAGRLRLIRQLLTECLLLITLAGTLGLLVTFWNIDFLLALIPDKLRVPRLDQVKVDSDVIVFTLLISLVTGIIFGLVPGLRTSRVILSESLKQGTKGSSTHVPGWLVIIQMALALTLLIGAGLMVRSFLYLQKVDPGINSSHLLTMRIPLAKHKYARPQQQTTFYQEVLDRIRRLPGVQSAALINTLPLSGSPLIQIGFTAEGSVAPGVPTGSAVVNTSSPDYFRTMGMPMLKGRHFTEQDSIQASKVAIVNESMARRFWGSRNPIGKRLKAGGPDSGNPWVTVVGVVGDVKQRGLNTETSPTMYWPFAQYLGPTFFSTLVVKTRSDPMSLASTVQREIWSLDGGQPLLEMRTMERVISESIWRPRFSAVLLSIFATLAVILAALGLYGVMSYAVTQRTYEIGVRRALGATSGDVLLSVLTQAMRLTMIGLAIGLAAAFALTIVALAATCVPAYRASRVDPMVALRYE
jgi:putative ABC transport system permease protein